MSIKNILKKVEKKKENEFVSGIVWCDYPSIDPNDFETKNNEVYNFGQSFTVSWDSITGFDIKKIPSENENL